MGKYFITAEQLWSSFGGTDAPIVVDQGGWLAVDLDSLQSNFPDR